MKIKRIMTMFFLILYIGSFATTTTNAFLDAQNAQENNETYKQIERQNQQSNDDPVLFNLGSIMSTAATGASLYNLAGAVRGINSSSIGSENDTSTNPNTWKVRLKPWQVILAAIFMARELREVGRTSGGDGSVNNAGTESSPIGEIKNTNDIRTRIVMNLFKVTGNIADKVGRGLSNILAIFLLLIGTLEILINILKGITNPSTEEPKTILMIMKDMFPQIAFMGILISILANGFFWNFYTGPLFNLSARIGGMLSGKSFNMYDMPDYLTKLFDVPLKVIASGVKMLFSVKGVMNNINPMLILIAGLMLLWMSIKAAIEIMMVLVDYLLIGCFAMVTIVFMALGMTKSIGSGAIGGVIASIVNIIVMFALVGYAFQIIDKLDGQGSSDISKLLGIIVGVFIVFGLLKQIKTIGNYLHSGSAAFIQGSSITTEAIDAYFNMAMAGAAVKGALNKIAKPKNTPIKGATGGGRGAKDILSTAQKNVGKNISNAAGKSQNLSELKNRTKAFATGDDDKKLDEWVKNKVYDNNEKRAKREEKKKE